MVESSARVGSRLPWAQDRAERTRFGVILLVVGILFLVPSLLIPGVELPERDRAESEQVPPRLARLIEKPAPVAPPPEPLTQEPEPVPEPVDELPTPPEAAEVVEVPAPTLPAPVQSADQARETAARSRSEEHTSELQSRPHLVCRLLPEKKSAVYLRWRPSAAPPIFAPTKPARSPRMR